MYLGVVRGVMGGWLGHLLEPKLRVLDESHEVIEVRAHERKRDEPSDCD